MLGPSAVQMPKLKSPELEAPPLPAIVIWLVPFTLTVPICAKERRYDGRFGEGVGAGPPMDRATSQLALCQSRLRNTR